MTEEDRWLLDKLKANLQQLFATCQKLEQQNVALEKELEISRQRIKEIEADKLEIGRECEQLKMANQLLSGKNESQEAKIKINNWIREIDKCIALLNK